LAGEWDERNVSGAVMSVLPLLFCAEYRELPEAFD
jgi:hypothetical protein